VSGFDADWLSLREPVDRCARHRDVLRAAAAKCSADPRVTVTDLACGTGATLRALSPILAADQAWLLVDHDPALLAAAARLAAADVPAAGRPTNRLEVRTRQADLAVELEAVVAVEATLLTMSAFLDLVPDAWLERLVVAAARHGRPVYAALSYDGRVGCEPEDPLDAAVLAAFDAHQRRDKGLGAALGPAAAAAAVRRFEAAGFSMTVGRSDWRLGPHEPLLQRRLVLGWHRAVAETGRVAPAALDAWLVRRLAAIAAGRSRLEVGHVDFLALPG
jgi:SAM-dependent methyltransferase